VSNSRKTAVAAFPADFLTTKSGGAIYRCITNNDLQCGQVIVSSREILLIDCLDFFPQTGQVASEVIFEI